MKEFIFPVVPQSWYTGNSNPLSHVLEFETGGGRFILLNGRGAQLAAVPITGTL